jgi:biotin synthase-like enzyme
MCFMAGANAIFTVRRCSPLSLLAAPSRSSTPDSIFLAAPCSSLTPRLHPQGERMLTTPTSGWDEDISMLNRWGLRQMKSFESPTVVAKENPELMAATEGRRTEEAATAAAAAPASA